jgi:putative phage-type endonuclease
MLIKQDFTWDRSQFLGGSDIGAILGLSKYRTPLQVWMEKTGKSKSFKGSLATRFGHFNEAFVASEYAQATDQILYEYPEAIIHPEHPYFQAHIDRLILDPKQHINKDANCSADIFKNASGILECKTANPFAKAEWGEPGTDQVPLPYLCQCIWYLLITQLPKADLAVLFGNSDFVIYSINKDIELGGLIVQKAEYFWSEYVLKDLPPPTQTEDDCLALFKNIAPKQAKEANGEIAEDIHKLIELSTQIKNIEAQVSTLKQSVMNYLQEADTLTFENHILATWKTANPAKRFDAKGFAAIHPKLYEQFLVTGNSTRRFVLKGGDTHA